ncbi:MULTISPECIES: hypothetical protein [unclassified Streptomyces]|uniref:hypothetical protein n=1 Tax=unclassified Streptomyces TaxID=2593676 RepID=UPI002E29D6AE|nr:hypothetical protein [Streptomyces sp. NBC_00223]
MTFSTSSSAFAAVSRHFDDPRAREDVRLTVAPDGDGGQPLSLSPAEAREALYEPASDPALSAAIWQEALVRACADRTPGGSWQLLLIWLALPQLTGTAYRICGRLRADRADVESEMILALLEELRIADPATLPSAQALIKAARSHGWRFARAGLRERPSAHLENLADDSCRTVTGGENLEQQDFEVEVVRPDGPDGLRAPLRFPIPAERLEREVLNSLADDLGLHEVMRRAGHSRNRRRIGTLSLRRRARRR